jgi:hypothetical protein
MMKICNLESGRGGVFGSEASRRRFWDWEFHRDIIHCILMIKGFAFGFLLIALHRFAAMLHDVKQIKLSIQLDCTNLVFYSVFATSSLCLDTSNCVLSLNCSCFPSLHQHVPVVLGQLFSFISSLK